MQTLISNIVISILFTLLLSTQSQASNFIKNYGKNWQVGVGGYAVVVDGHNNRNELGGNSLSVAFVLNDYVAVQGQIYSIDNDESYNFDISGYDINAYFGNNLHNNGFKYYSGFGFYKETLEYSSGDDNITGAQVSGGIGYNWPYVSLDLTLSYRSVGDYADYYNEDNNNVTAMSSSLTVAYRF